MEYEKIDVLNREPIVNQIQELIERLLENKKGGSFAIDGAWGSGKTFVLNMLESQLALVQDEETADNRYFVFHYNCWEYDYYDEPSIAIVSAMLDQTRDKYRELARACWNMAKEKLEKIAGSFIKNNIGFDPIKLGKKAIGKCGDQDNQKFDDYYSYKKALDEARQHIADIANEKAIIFIVDELDRCQPTYAIKVLERLHHFFVDQENIVLVISMDSTQIDNTIHQIYGQSTETDNYLRKFIDFKIKLGMGELQSSLENKYEYFFKNVTFVGGEHDDVIATIKDILNASKIDIRNQEKIFEKASVINSILFDEAIDDRVAIFELLLLVCLFYTAALEDNESQRISGYYHNLKWLPRIYNSSYNNLNIPDKLHDYLKELCKKNIAQQRDFDGVFYTPKKTLIGDVLYAYDAIYNERKDMFFLWEEHTEGFFQMLDKCKDIDNLARLIV